MGDEPYAVMLPWVVFAVIDRAKGQGVAWAAVGAVAAALTVAATRRRDELGTRDVLIPGATVWFSALGVLALAYNDQTSWVAHDGRAISAGGFVLIALASLASTPMTMHYTRPHVRPSRWDDPAFLRVNVRMTLLWSAGFAGISLSSMTARWIDSPPGYTTLNWIVPLALFALVAHRSHAVWEDFDDDVAESDLDRDPMWDLAFDWDATPRSEQT
jgi:hypothetical protein